MRCAPPGLVAAALALTAAGSAQATITPSGALAIAQAIASPSANVTGASFVTVPGGTPVAVSTTALAGFPSDGSSFGVLSTGNASEVGSPATFASTSDGGGPVRGNTDMDVTVLKIDLSVPAGANCLSFDFRFLSEEYPGYVGTLYNDAFVAELDTSTWTTSGSTINAPDNFAFDGSHHVVSINSTGIGGMSAANGAGTAFDGGTTYLAHGFAAPHPGPAGGATVLLQASHQVTPGAHSLYLSLFDQGDRILDSAVFLDDLVVGSVPDPTVDCVAGAHPVSSITAAGTTINAVEGTPFSGTVATFGVPDASATAGDFAATIDWGDGTPTTSGTITGSAGSFTVAGTHTYAEESPPAGVKVTITAAANAANTATATSTATVADAALTAGGLSLVGGPTYAGPVATFTDANAGSTPADFTATVDWGDAHVTSGSVTGSAGSYSVNGTHTYATTGSFTIVIHVADDGGSTADAATTMVIFAAPGAGTFVIGSGNASVGTGVTFWGSQWSRENDLGGGAAPAQFKGFATTPATLPACGTTWSTRPGSSAPPPDGPLPPYMVVVVTGSVWKSGSTISGDVTHEVVVRTDPGYEPDAGHAGTGTVVATIC
jgi:hypothetical protein